jgi:ribulose-5-phosphate 4-epimerase/fuculose-1-phosphate aldolase
MGKKVTLDDLHPAYPDAPKGMDDGEWRARVDLAAAYRLTHFYGWTSVVYNHITLRVPGTDSFLINPFGLRYDEITASNLILIDLDGNKIDPDNKWPVNKAGYLIHSAVHRARPDDLHCVMHTHETHSQTMCALNVEAVPMVQEACQLFERIGYHEFEGIVLDTSEQERLVAALGDVNHTLVLRNHGLITAGPSVAWAFVRHQHFIRNAEIQLRAMASGGDISYLSAEVMRHTRHQFEGGDAQGGAAVRHPEWPAFLRLLDGIDPDWKS